VSICLVFFVLSGCAAAHSSIEDAKASCDSLVRLMSDDGAVRTMEVWFEALPKKIPRHTLIQGSSRFRGMGAYMLPFPVEFSPRSLGLPSYSEIRVAADKEGIVTMVLLAVEQGIGIYFEVIDGGVDLFTLEAGRRDRIGVLCLRGG